MDYFKVNYSKLENMYQINYNFVLIGIVIALLLFIILSSIINVTHTVSFYGIYSNGTLQFKINYMLSDVVKNGEYLTFNNEKTKYEIINYLDYEIYNDNVYQNIELKVDKNFIDNEVGLVKIHYHKEKLISYILKLFN